MGNLSSLGRVFYGLAIAVMGFLTISDKDFPYMIIPPRHSWIPVFVMIVAGAVIFLAGLAIVFKLRARPIALLLGSTLLLIFCFYHVPYEIIAGANYLEFGEWENAFKELTLSSGAFAIAGCFPETSNNVLMRFLAKLIPYGKIVFSIAILSFGIDHFLYAKEASDYVPTWIPHPLFWIYFCGIALAGSAIAIILKIKVRLAATLLGTMILIWFIILHIPRVIVSLIAAPDFANVSSEVASGMLALAYSGIAFVIAGIASKKPDASRV